MELGPEGRSHSHFFEFQSAKNPHQESQEDQYVGDAHINEPLAFAVLDRRGVKHEEICNLIIQSCKKRSFHANISEQSDKLEPMLSNQC